MDSLETAVPAQLGLGHKLGLEISGVTLIKFGGVGKLLEVHTIPA